MIHHGRWFFDTNYQYNITCHDCGWCGTFLLSANATVAEQNRAINAFKRHGDLPHARSRPMVNTFAFIAAPAAPSAQTPETPAHHGRWVLSANYPYFSGVPDRYHIVCDDCAWHSPQSLGNDASVAQQNKAIGEFFQHGHRPRLGAWEMVNSYTSVVQPQAKKTPKMHRGRAKETPKMHRGRWVTAAPYFGSVIYQIECQDCAWVSLGLLTKDASATERDNAIGNFKHHAEATMIVNTLASLASVTNPGDTRCDPASAQTQLPNAYEVPWWSNPDAHYGYWQQQADRFSVYCRTCAWTSAEVIAADLPLVRLTASDAFYRHHRSARPIVNSFECPVVFDAPTIHQRQIQHQCRQTFDLWFADDRRRWAATSNTRSSSPNQKGPSPMTISHAVATNPKRFYAFEVFAYDALSGEVFIPTEILTVALDPDAGLTTFDDLREKVRADAATRAIRENPSAELTSLSVRVLSCDQL